MCGMQRGNQLIVRDLYANRAVCRQSMRMIWQTYSSISIIMVGNIGDYVRERERKRWKFSLDGAGDIVGCV